MLGKLSGSFQTFVPHSGRPSIRSVRPLSAALSYPLSLIQRPADQAKELGIEIDLNYTFAQPKKTDE
jgi:hypothetical protein